MPPDYVIFICFALALYLYINQYNQIRSTTSAIRSVFTGECAMACRQSQASGLSGLSNLHGPGTSHNCALVGPNCVCESCPCPLLESFIRTCSPATRMYTSIISTLSQLYCNIISIIHQAISFGIWVARVNECRVSCQSPKAMTDDDDLVDTTNYDSKENFGLMGDEKEDFKCKSLQRDESKLLKDAELDTKIVRQKSSLAGIKEKFSSKLALARKQSDLRKKKESKKGIELDSNDEPNRPRGSKSKESIKKGNSDFKESVKKGDSGNKESAKEVDSESKKSAKEVDESSQESVSSDECPKCEEKGVKCVRECPMAKK